VRYGVRIEELDASFDIGRVWDPSEEEAIRLVLDFIDYVDRRPLYDRPVSGYRDRVHARSGRSRSSLDVGSGLSATSFGRRT
jgi:hypothetical protein